MTLDILKGLVDDAAACSDDNDGDEEELDGADDLDENGSLCDFINDDPSQSQHSTPEPSPQPKKKRKILKRRGRVLEDTSSSEDEAETKAETMRLEVSLSSSSSEDEDDKKEAVIQVKETPHKEEAVIQAKEENPYKHTKREHQRELAQKNSEPRNEEKHFAYHESFCKQCKSVCNKRILVRTDNIDTYFEARAVCQACGMETDL